jgi:hypothetical protein
MLRVGVSIEPFGEPSMRIKTLSIVAALVVGATSLAIAQTPPTTGGLSPYPNNAGAAQEPTSGTDASVASGKSTHHKKLAKHHKTSGSKT